MSKLYNELANVYHEMYQSIFDYKQEFEKYNSFLKEYNCKNILEVGCGSGNLSKYFLNEGYDYVGTDLSNDMLNIAKKNNPGISFLKADMRELRFDKLFDAIIISGRSFTYMTKNDDVNACLSAVYNSLEPNGLLIFDNFDAFAIFKNFNCYFEQTSLYEGKKYRRISNNTMNFQSGWTWNWNATYYIVEPEKETIIIEDKSILRAFTEDELSLFLAINNFNVLKIIKETSAFTTLAQRK